MSLDLKQDVLNAIEESKLLKTGEVIRKLADDEVHVKEERLRIFYNDGVLKDEVVYIRPCLTVARDNYVDMTIENRFYDDEAIELYKKLTGR